MAAAGASPREKNGTERTAWHHFRALSPKPGAAFGSLIRFAVKLPKILSGGGLGRAWLRSLLSPCGSAGPGAAGAPELPEGFGKEPARGRVLGAHGSPSTELMGFGCPTALPLVLSTALRKCQHPITSPCASSEELHSIFPGKLPSVFCLEGRKGIFVTTVSATVVKFGHLPCMLPNKNTCSSSLPRQFFTGGLQISPIDKKRRLLQKCRNKITTKRGYNKSKNKHCLVTASRLEGFACSSQYPGDPLVPVL